MFERAQASEFVSASAWRLFAEGTGANAPAQPVDPPHGYRPGRRAPEKAYPSMCSSSGIRYRLSPGQSSIIGKCPIPFMRL